MNKLSAFLIPGLLTFLLAATRCFSQGAELHPGNYNVGFKYVYLLDKTRNWEPFPFDSANKPKLKLRPIRIAIWYPAKKGSKEFMKVKNYINPAAPDNYFGKLNEIMNTFDMWSYNGMFDKKNGNSERHIDNRPDPFSENCWSRVGKI